MNVLLCPNLDKKDGLICTQKTAEKLLELGAKPLMDESFRDTVGEIGCEYGRFSALLGVCDLLMPIGGDGTIMRAARHAVSADKPVLAVNAGRLGFLTQVELSELDHLRLLVEGRHVECRRMMLEAELAVGGKARRFSALNEVVVGRGNSGGIADLEVRQRKMLIARHRADGVLFATPTGSTAYSLSAGGPIVDPHMTMFLLTAVCPHSTFNRTMILPAEQEYSVCGAIAGDSGGLTVAVDGRRVGRIRKGESLTVRKSKSAIRFIDLGLRTFYESVNEKLSWGR